MKIVTVEVFGLILFIRCVCVIRLGGLEYYQHTILGTWIGGTETNCYYYLPAGSPYSFFVLYISAKPNMIDGGPI